MQENKYEYIGGNLWGILGLDENGFENYNWVVEYEWKSNSDYKISFSGQDWLDKVMTIQEAKLLGHLLLDMSKGNFMGENKWRMGD